MGLFDAITSAVSGLQAQAFAMQNISGNIANSQTIAYKGINTSFEDLIPGVTVASQQVAGGVIASSVATNTVQGAIQSATSSTDDGHQRRRLFHRAIASRLYRQYPDLRRRRQLYAPRRLSNSMPKAIWSTAAAIISKALPIDPTTGNPIGTAAAPLQFQNNFLPANPTTAITYGINLPATPQTVGVRSRGSQFRTAQSGGFHRQSDPTTAGTGTVIGNDVATFLNESVDGGSVTVYNANGTPANLQLQMGKDRQRRQRRQPTPGICFTRPTRPRPARTSRGKMSAPISSSIQPAN